MSSSPTKAASPRRPARSNPPEGEYKTTYHEHEGIYFRLVGGHINALRRDGEWVRPELGVNTSYLGIDVRTYGTVVTKEEAESQWGPGRPA